jgi:hypothetical protein
MSKSPLGEFGDILSWEQIWLGLGVEFEEFHRLMKAEEDWYAVFGNALLVNTEHLQKIWKEPAARQKLKVVDLLAIIKAAAKKILEPDFPKELLPKEFVVLGQDAADDRLRDLAAEKNPKPKLSRELLSRNLIELAVDAARDALGHAAAIEKLGDSFLRSENAALLLLEGIKLGVAMYKVELWTERWPSIECLREESQKRKTRLKINSSKAVAARKKKLGSGGKSVATWHASTSVSGRSVERLQVFANLSSQTSC